MPDSTFTPIGATVSLGASTASSSVALTAINDRGGMEVRLYNSGSATAFIEFGNSAVTVDKSASLPLPAGAVETFTIGPSVTHMAAVTAAGSALIYATSGRGQ